ncbi:hypothetical protein HII17_09990 [Thalassotalea sp. M1531]|uniref:Amino acid ABC transporter substrate-binding protein n=1 Tax=Thalassotalea algicola TaxID=2716224 RepID=A0A7Y0Q775_9GAMM|nr:hypothetical protein [Thalassotalea algicola]NMP31896.1 hypothetical protein [Thalassotalea algicola]
MLIIRKLILLLVFGCFCQLALGQQVVRYNISLKFTDSKQSYYIDLLELALKNTVEEFGAYKLEPVVIEMPQGRTAIMVEKSDLIDVTWRMTSQELEQSLSAIYWPLLKGLMGYRVFIIGKDKQEQFSQISVEEQLKILIAGQGSDWPDADILQANGYNLMRSPASGLLNMLEKGRLDYFPRALHEPWVEIAERDQFSVEKHIMLRYPAPMFFFVNKENHLLRDRLSLGLQRAFEQGDFEKLFQHHPITKNVLERAKIDERIVFELTNPLLSERALASIEKIQPYITH